MKICIPEGFAPDDLPQILAKVGQIVRFMGADHIGPTVIDIPLKAEALELDLFAAGNHHAVHLRRVGGTWQAFTDGTPGTLPKGFRVSSAAKYFGPTQPKMRDDTSPWNTDP
ncbi:hypothetical protein [Sphingomonas sp. AX6]|uniref:hypothetical protein n=1 Tax=Sphingomonas sp. AX6 TaxID=2653171 RepID=UPI0012F10C05|nr:hypothetical protein [Sphingomonas sp. AX6]VXC95715.1 hypothetical protein SPHINGOAX6_70564 [Sphingomonas sp. AX6]